MTDSFRPTVIRNQAWEALRGKWNMAALIYLVLGVLICIAACVPLANLLIVPILMTGARFIYQDVDRGGDVELNTLWTPFKEYVRYLVANLLVILYTLLWTLLFIIPGIIKSLSYSQVFYIMRENPDMGGEEAIKLSMKMMKGHKWELFLLQLSFIGWIVLGFITFGIGLLWVYPYILTATARFWDELKKNYDASEAFRG